MTGVLAVIHPRVYQRGSVQTHAREMVAARMALAMRDNPPQALQRSFPVRILEREQAH